MSGMVKRFLFITHVGDPGGAEFTMIPICQALGTSAEVLLLEHGSLERILTQHGIAHRVEPLGATAGSVRRAPCTTPSTSRSLTPLSSGK